MVRNFFTLFSLLIVSFSYAQAPFSREIFNTNFEIARYLVEYDEVATRTSDTLMDVANRNEGERLGKDRFCYRDEKGVWHAVYGKYYLGEFDQVFHFTIDQQRKLRRSKSGMDTSVANSFARAIRSANTTFRDMMDSSGVYFETLAIKDSNRAITVWMLPAVQPNGAAVFGRAYSFTTDEHGLSVQQVTNTNREPIIIYNLSIPAEIWINNLRNSEPTVPALFAAWYYRENFSRIHIESRAMISTLMKEPDGTYGWLHITPPENVKKKKKGRS